MPDTRAVSNGRIFTPVIPVTIMRWASTLVVRAMIMRWASTLVVRAMIMRRASTLVVRAMIMRRISTLVVRAMVIGRTITACRSQPQGTGFGSASQGAVWPGLQLQAGSLKG